MLTHIPAVVGTVERKTKESKSDSPSPGLHLVFTLSYETQAHVATEVWLPRASQAKMQL